MLHRLRESICPSTTPQAYCTTCKTSYWQVQFTTNTESVLEDESCSEIGRRLEDISRQAVHIQDSQSVHIWDVYFRHAYNFYTEMIMREADTEKLVVTIGGRKVSNIRYADDTVLIVGSEGNLQIMLNGVRKSSEDYTWIEIKCKEH